MGFLFIVNSFFSCKNIKNKNEQKSDIVVVDTVVVKEPILKYGLPVDSFHIEIGFVKSNQYLRR